MILVGNSRGGARDLARHLLKEENEHIELHELRGFASDDLAGALSEAYAISRGTRCQKFLFSLSLNPPPQERVDTATFEAAITKVEDRLGLSGCPRAIVFHEKEGRRHAHAVWSRIDPQEMKAIQLSHSKMKLRDVARELYLEHGWRMPRGLMDSKQRDPRNFTLAEWQQARRAGKDPREIKTAIQECWAVSDSRASFEAALGEHGLVLARGDRRGFVALDHEGEVYAIASQAGIKTKDVRARLGDDSTLPSVDEAKLRIAREMQASANRLRLENLREQRERRTAFEERRLALVERQRGEREAALRSIETRQNWESRERQQRFRSGLGGLWDRLRGEHARIQKANEAEAYAALLRDRAEKDALIFRQLDERQRLGADRRQHRHEGVQRARDLRADAEHHRNFEAAASKDTAREGFLEERRRPSQRPPTRSRNEPDREH